ncbi:MAG TPA: DinB family protein, partial [Methylomirabilota bacterium]|nr:DinB family protein [Methylomirabilota bacterium]
MSTEYIRTLYQYSAWANGRILDTAAGLAPGQLTEGAGASHGSVRDTLVHTMSAQWIWLQRWKGVSPRAMLRAGDFPDLDAIRTHWAALERETRDFVEGLGEAQLARVISYTNARGQEWTYPLWQMLIHQVN